MLSQSLLLELFEKSAPAAPTMGMVDEGYICDNPDFPHESIGCNFAPPMKMVGKSTVLKYTLILHLDLNPVIPANHMTSIDQRITVQFDFPVHFTRGLFRVENSLLADTIARLDPAGRHRVLFVIDENVAACHPNLVNDIAGYCAAFEDQLEAVGDPLLVPGGEAVKNDPGHLFDLVEQVHIHGIDRHSYLAIIGGGAVLDMACFAAAIAHRSVRAIRIPTTVLSQDDSGVGVKNGINLHGKKNFIGTFLPPFAVLNDIEFIATLPLRDRLAGVAEAVKVALIRDSAFFADLERNADALAEGGLEALEPVIIRSAEHHMTHIRTSGDPFELGSARPLDFGHWAAHKMESVTRNRLRHGEAVAIGMALDTLYSTYKGYLSPDKGERVLSLLERIGLPLWDEQMLECNEDGALRVLEGLQEFREHLGGKLTVTLLRDIGAGFEVNEMDESLVIAALHALKARSEAPELAPVTAAG